MKDIMLKIKGTQIFEEQEDNVEFITEGRLYQKNGSFYLLYDETEILGMDGYKTIMKVKGDTVKLRRVSKDGPGSELFFEKGNRFFGTCYTPFGIINVEILTTMVSNKLDYDDGTGQVDIDYKISLEGKSEGRNKLVIDVS